MDLTLRRTVRHYSEQPVSDELLNSLLEQASHTQTMGNLQLYSVIVTRDDVVSLLPISVSRW